MTKLGQLKEELKKLAVEIRKGKINNKEIQRLNGGRAGFGYRADANTYRHMHIVYCLLRGRTMEQIENKNREHNEPNTYLINKYMEVYREEAICVN